MRLCDGEDPHLECTSTQMVVTSLLSQSDVLLRDNVCCDLVLYKDI